MQECSLVNCAFVAMTTADTDRSMRHDVVKFVLVMILKCVEANAKIAYIRRDLV